MTTPPQPDAQLEEARRLLAAGKRSRAEKLIENLIAQDAGNLPAWFLGVSLMETPARKIRMLETCLKHNPDHPRVLQAIQSVKEGLAWNDLPPPPSGEKAPTPIPLSFNDPVSTLRAAGAMKRSPIEWLADTLRIPETQAVERRLVLGGLGAVVLVLVIGGAWGILRGVGGQMDRAAAALCNSGTAIPASAGYTKGSGVHPIAVITAKGGSPPAPSEYPAGWLPASLDKLELVACTYPAEEVIEVCEYSTGPAVTRYRSLLRIDLYTALEGQVLDRLLVYNDPPPCDEIEAHETSELKAEAPTPAQLFAEVERHVNSIDP